MSFSATRHHSLLTNGFKVAVPDTIDVIVRDFADPSGVKLERERLKGFWFVHWVGGKLYHLRLNSGGPNVDGAVQTLRTSEHPWLIRARLDDVIGDALDRYTPFRVRPFTFLAQKTELLQSAAESAHVAHILLSGFKVTPRFILNAKIYEPIDGASALGVFVNARMHYDIDVPLGDLKAANVDLAGMYVVRRTPEKGQRRLAGRVAAIEGTQTRVSEGADAETLATDTVKLEGSKENFARCLNSLLGARGYRALTAALDDQQAAYSLGPAFDKVVARIGTVLGKKNLNLGQRAQAKIGERIILDNEDTTRSVYVTPPIDYVFDRTGAKSAPFAWKGLSQFGPYDRPTFTNKSPRLLVAFPASTQGKVEAFLSAFRDGMGASYQAYSNGFRGVFGLVNVEFVMCPVAVTSGDRATAHMAYREAIQAKLSSGEDVHCGIIVLFEEHAFLPGLQNPYIQTKALLLTLGIPSQEVRMPTINQAPGSLQYTLQNFSVSTYAKLNGIPWTVNQDKAINDELVIGIGFAELSGNRFEERQRYAGITTVFSGDGTYILGNVSKECAYNGYPAMMRESMLAILREVKTRNNWRPGDTIRVIFHAHRPLKRVDVGNIVFACAREIGSEQDIQMAFVTVSHDHPFYIMDPKERGEPIKRDSMVMKGAFAPARGTIARIGRSTRLLAVNSGKLIKRQNSPLPAPLLISLHPDSTFKDVDFLAEQALKFTSLSWRSVLPAETPVTIFYSERIAELLGRLKDVPDFSTTALSVKLKWSRWFL
jgi:Piwi domain